MNELVTCLAKPATRFAGMLFLFLFLTVGCMDNPATWPPERIATNLAKTLEVSDLTLTPSTQSSDGSNSHSTQLEGTGKRTDGETLTVIVTLHPDTYEYRYEAKGDRGFVETGNYVIEQVR